MKGNLLSLIFNCVYRVVSKNSNSPDFPFSMVGFFVAGRLTTRLFKYPGNIFPGHFTFACSDSSSAPPFDVSPGTGQLRLKSIAMLYVCSAPEKLKHKE